MASKIFRFCEDIQLNNIHFCLYIRSLFFIFKMMLNQSQLCMCVLCSGSNCRCPLLLPQQRGESTHSRPNVILISKLSASQTLNSPSFVCEKVQSELRRTWRSLSLKRYVGRDYRLHATSVSRNGTENSAQCPRNSRAQSILQTETTVL